MSQPIAITFHFPSSSSSLPSSSNPSSRTLSKRKIATNNRILASSYFTIDKPSNKSSKPTEPTTKSNNAVVSPSGTSSNTSTTSITTTTTTTGSKRRKGPVYVIPPTNVKLASLTPLLKPIVSRCSTSSSSTTENPNVEESIFSYHHSPSRKRSKRSTPIPSSTIASSYSLHPYSKSSDLSNTRSNIPSPKEIERSKRLEEEKIRLKKENAAVARANAIAKRKSNRKTTTTTNTTVGRASSKVPASRRGSLENPSPLASKPTSPDNKNNTNNNDSTEVPVITTQAASEGGSSPILGSRPNSLKRTRSQGVLPISTTISNSVTGSPVIGSPLKEVMSRDSDSELDPNSTRKKSKLNNEQSASEFRRANTHSPTGTPSSLPFNELDDERLSKTVPLTNGKVLPAKVKYPLPSYPPRASSQTPESVLGGGSKLRRSSSSFIPSITTRLEFERPGSVGSVGSVGSTTASENGRVRRETRLPEGLRDYEMKPPSIA
ncbi:uncharacterized protein L201_006929 [Kwoniella dendrophila CBS 6074]|uniref:Uncharacterized protein n=1 Tax=Kwoniella dendrophila CBS 6074 TaxID=1295534 RepID=A0AAX4K2Q5_9TREE